MNKFNVNPEIEDSIRIENITNALWLKVFADNLSRSVSNNLSCIYDKSDTSIYSSMIDAVIDACSDLLANDRSLIPHYLRKMYICNDNELRSWLNYLKKEEILSDENVELLMYDYRSTVEETEQGD